MKLSRYTLFYDDYPNKGEYLAYNTRTQGILGINQEVKDFIDKITNHRYTQINTEKSEEERGVINSLKESGIIIDKDTNENSVLENWFNGMKYNSDTLHATILTTYKCNFACVYCFEERVKEPKTLDEQTTAQIIEWLKYTAESKRLKSLRLMFYGGEPLMNTKAIFDIAGALQPWAKERNIKFRFSITTNGSLLKPELVDKLVEVGLKSVRITLDGEKELHDKRRPYLDGRGTFDTIINNIIAVADRVHPVRGDNDKRDTSSPTDSAPRLNTSNGVKVEIGANFDKENIKNLYALLDYLEAKGLNKKISGCIFGPVIARLGAPLREATDGQDATQSGFIPTEMVGCHTLSGELADEALKLRREVIRRGYKVDRAAVVTGCPMEQDYSMVVIDPFGDIYKCAGFVGRKEFSVGHVRDSGFNHRHAEFITLNPWKQCGGCVYVPMCGGGCRLMAQLKHNDYTKPYCDKEYYENTFPELLKMDFERGVI